MTMKGPERPSKLCPTCQRPFQWRARWRLNWEQVKYCSRRCANQRGKLNRSSPPTAPGNGRPSR
ncbi:MAG: DUF2256 domain-containing protein [Haliea sp.]|uniref:DUF2256 domain-containing protein n=1 Tax=Haliea sp. TaxID=1932666 RepID=UPI0032EBEFBA